MAPSSTATDPDTTFLEGIVVRSTGRWYDVRADDRLIRSRIRGKFRLADTDVTNPVAVGDRVTIRLSEEDQTGLITEIHDRSNKFSRRAAGPRTGEEHVLVANIDWLWIVMAVRRPAFNARFLDRTLVAASVHDIPAGLIINKMDLLAADDRPAVMDFHLRYVDLGYPVILTSATEGEGLDRVKKAFHNHINAIAGPSGTGKSTLINAIEPGLSIETGPVSPSTRKGTHTTTHAELHPLSIGGFVVDTPGIREFGVHEVPPSTLSHHFPDFRPYLDACQFSDCTHDHEPGCAVKAAVEQAKIHPERYDSYLQILESLREEYEPNY